MNINQQITAQVARKEHDKEEARRLKQKELFNEIFKKRQRVKKMKQQQYDYDMEELI